MRVCACGPERPGNAITVAPFREGMNQPSSRRPSLVVKETFSGVGEEALDEPRVRDAVTHRLARRTLGHDRLERGVVRGGVNQHLAADRQPDPADPLRIDIRAATEIVDGGVEIAVADPAEDVRVAVARTLAAAVEEEDAVAVADEHARLRLRA